MEKSIVSTTTFELDWNDHEPCWEFSSVGTRFLEDYVDGLSEYILKVLDMLEFTSKRNKEEY